MLLYKSHLKKPEHLKNFKYVVNKDVRGEGKYYIITKEKEDLNTAIDLSKDKQWTEREKYSICNIPEMELIPEKISKNTQLPGPVVQLGKHKWIIPLIRKFPIGSTLPTNVVFNLDGTKSYKVKQEYYDLCCLGEEIEKSTQEWNSGNSSVDLDTVRDYYHRILSVNYEITLDDIGLNDMISSDDWINLLLEAIDGHTLIKFFSSSIDDKKKLLKNCGLTDECTDAFLQLLSP